MDASLQQCHRLRGNLIKFDEKAVVQTQNELIDMIYFIDWLIHLIDALIDTLTDALIGVLMHWLH